MDFMKTQFINHWISGIVVILTITACESYLDKSPDLGLDESAVFESYESIRGYLDGAYSNMDKWHSSAAIAVTNHLTHTDELASTVTKGNYMVNTITTGNWYTTERNSTWEIGDKGSTVISNAYSALRIVNKVINGINGVRDITDEEKIQILAQARFYRAWFYYQLIIRYGGMPIIDKAFVGGDENISRKTYRESHEWMMQDIEYAVENLPDSWDDKNYGRPDKAAAMGFRAQALLYAASPLFQNGLDHTEKKEYDRELCLDAALAAQECLDLVQGGTTGRRFTTGNMDSYRSIFILPATANNHEEYLWWNRNSADQIVTIRIWWNWAAWDSKSAGGAQAFGAPTTNIVRYYERKGADGIYYPITDPRSGYEEGKWSAMKDRDPRLYNNILLPGRRWGDMKGAPNYVTSWEGGTGYNVVKNGSLSSSSEFTGYLCCKYTWPGANNVDLTDNTGFNLFSFRSFYIRVTEMYLDYAEALFEATGSATTAPAGFKMTPAEALNIVRARVGVTPIASDYLTPETFRDTYRRERVVEMMFENHRWNDIRRWMIFDEVFPTTTPIYNTVWTCEQGVNANGADYNDGEGLSFTWRVEKNNVEVRNYTDKHYLYPFSGAVVGSQTNLKQNPGW